jgi:glutamate/tyrosine decarboxylase-like PLP-dependent enzyme
MRMEEIEQHLIRTLGERFGYDPARVEGIFTAEGAEANQAALHVAMTRSFPEVARRGLLALRSQPVVYVSPEGDPAIHRAARLASLGAEAVREIRTDARLRMRPDLLAARIREDREAGASPFLVVANAGTRGAGIIDPLEEIAQIADEERLWLHVDASWGGAAALVPELRPAIQGIARASSVSFDVQQGLGIPTGPGLFLTRYGGILERTFGSASTRPFSGFQQFLASMAAGWDGQEAAIRHQAAMADRLREGLRAAGWTVVNETPLPVVCFTGGEREEKAPAFLEAVAARVVEAGQAWIGTVSVGDLGTALRACADDPEIGPEDVDALVSALGKARQDLC